MYIYELAGENLELAEAELEGFLESQNLEPGTWRNGSLAFTRSEPDQLKRLALVHSVYRVVDSGMLGDPDTDYSPEKSFRVESDGNSGQLVEEFGGLLESSENSVDLENPDTEVKLFAFEGFYLLAEKVLDIDRGLFEQRKNQERPYSSPVSLDPVLARVMVNLAGVPPGEHVVDPFCGTGGNLIEAGLCGIGVAGADVDPEMVEGTRENLEAHGILNHEIVESDYRELPEHLEMDLHSVVTDLPYGRSSREEGSLDQVLDVFSELASERAVFAYNEPGLQGVEHSFEIYVHGSLTRYIYVYDLS